MFKVLASATVGAAAGWFAASTQLPKLVERMRKEIDEEYEITKKEVRDLGYIDGWDACEKKLYEKHAEEMAYLINDHKKELNEQIRRHSQGMERFEQTLNRKARRSLEQLREELEEGHKKEIKDLENNHREEIEELKSQHQKLLDGVTNEAKEMISNLKETNKTQLEIARSEAHKELNSIRAESYTKGRQDMEDELLQKHKTELIDETAKAYERGLEKALEDPEAVKKAYKKLSSKNDTLTD